MRIVLSIFFLSLFMTGCSGKWKLPNGQQFANQASESIMGVELPEKFEGPRTITEYTNAIRRAETFDSFANLVAFAGPDAVEQFEIHRLELAEIELRYHQIANGLIAGTEADKLQAWYEVLDKMESLVKPAIDKALAKNPEFKTPVLIYIAWQKTKIARCMATKDYSRFSLAQPELDYLETWIEGQRTKIKQFAKREDQTTDSAKGGA